MFNPGNSLIFLLIISNVKVSVTLVRSKYKALISPSLLANALERKGWGGGVVEFGID